MDTKILVKVYDAEMHPTGIEYFREDTPLKAFVPDWKHPVIVRKLPFGIDALPASELALDMKVGKLVYWPGIIGDTHAKEGRLIYTEKSDSIKLMDRFPNFFQFAEDTVRLGRAFIPDARNYGAYHGQITVLVVEPGTEIDGILYEDGSVSVDESLVDMHKGHPIELGATANNFSIFQGLDYPEVKDDVKMLGKKLRQDIRTMNIASIFHNETAGFSVDNMIKDHFLELCPQLIHHPNFSNAIGDLAARYMASHACAPYVNMRCYLAIASKHWTLPVGRHLVYRHPKIAGAGLRALDIKREHKLPDSILGGVVITLTGFWNGGEGMTIKGAGVIRKQQYGIITCNKNIKIGARMAPFEGIVDGHLVVLLRYHKDSLMGVPYKDGKPMNLDYDGDLINRAPADDIPQIFANVKKHEKDSASFKFVKRSKIPWSQKDALDVLVNAMHSSMGGATNMNSWWLAMNPKERTAILPKLWPAITELMLKMDTDLEPKDLPEMSLKAVDDILQYHVQYHVDAIKNVNCDTYRVSSVEARITSILSAATGKIPGHLTWRRGIGAGIVFKKRFPQFLDDMDPLMRSKTKADAKAKRHYDWRMQMTNQANGMATMCFKENKEPLEWMFESMLRREDNLVGTRMYSVWAPICSNTDYNAALELVDEFRKHLIRFERLRTLGTVSVASPEDMTMYREQWRDICARFVSERFGGDRQRAANAYWRAAHDSGEDKLTGGCFGGFTKETEFIVKNYAGSISANRCIVVGVSKLLPKLPDKLVGKCELLTLEGLVWVRPFEQIPGNKERLFGHIAEVKGKEIEEGMSVPADGEYQFTMTLRPSGTAYFAVFEPI